MTDGLRERMVAAFRAAAHDCRGNCGRSERECMDAYPIQVEVLRFDEVAVIGGPVEALADVALMALAPELERAETAEAERDRYAALLAEASEALRAVGKAAITVEPTLKKPYPEAPDTSPWERFMERPARRAYNLGQQIRRELRQASKESQ